MDMKETGYECVIWIDLTEESDQWEVIMSTISNLQAA
jgi:hypothetical protein